ncbi:aminotransferase class V-fold PLP-dependent enzyme [Streptomyces bambusae]|uniref:pyridoxal phosphate-dependent decarboxylase family protein n=1 Tax=Streptomyces bambusae TaxID=1550616 RepID=UPI001CFF2D08|nr:aminotransferase class V-fold PLP-dependent enzyme [Streptomyces bambusae]MCB5167779.1 aminotransferase class V-fold PLP-dependent enzyme [Streptomyces bambusae]
MTAPPGPHPHLPPLAGGTTGATALRPLLDTVLDALTTGARARSGPLPPGGPDTVTERLTTTLGSDLLPSHGTGDHEALHTLVHALAEGAADPADPRCLAHLHCPPLAVAAAADLAASSLNPSLDSWDQAPAATALETLLTRTLARELYDTPHPDALTTTGGTEANQLALLLAREHHGPVTLVHGANAHHSLPRAAWLLGLPTPLTLPTPHGTLDPATLDDALTRHPGPTLVAATAGTTDAGLIDPLPAIAAVCARHHTPLHVDAAYGGLLTLSPRHRHLLDGLQHAHTITLDLHKLGWQPAAAGLLAVPDHRQLTPLHHQADYLNATDDTEAGLPDLLGRSLRTTRRADVLKTAVTLRALGRTGLADLIDRTLATARTLADLIDAHPRFELHAHPTISTVLFRPTGLPDPAVAELRRTLLHDGRAVLGRTTADGRLWLKATLLNPHTTTDDLTHLLTLLEGSTHR